MINDCRDSANPAIKDLLTSCPTRVVSLLCQGRREAGGRRSRLHRKSERFLDGANAGGRRRRVGKARESPENEQEIQPTVTVFAAYRILAEAAFDFRITTEYNTSVTTS